MVTAVSQERIVCEVDIFVHVRLRDSVSCTREPHISWLKNKMCQGMQHKLTH